jgi:hypothetical protein
MSVVTGVIITCDLGEEDGDDNFPAINFVNEYLERERKGKLNHLNEYAGGFKAWQMDVFGGAFNYLDHSAFADVLRSAPWREPDNVTLLIHGENDEAAREVRLTNTEPFNASVKDFSL